MQLCKINRPAKLADTTVLTKIEINAPITKVFNLSLDKARFKEWKKDFVGYEPVSSAPAQQGAVTKLNYRKYAMIETILTMEEPRSYTASYAHIHSDRTMLVHTAANTFTALDDNRTLVEVDARITKVNNFLMKIMVRLMASADFYE